MNNLCCGSIIGMKMDSVPRMQQQQKPLPLPLPPRNGQTTKAQFAPQPLSKRKMYTSCESINMKAITSPVLTPRAVKTGSAHMLKRKLYMSCEALNTTPAELSPYENHEPDSYFSSTTNSTSKQNNNNNNTIKGYISHHQHYQQQQQRQQQRQQQLQQQRRATTAIVNSHSHSHHNINNANTIQHLKANSHPLSAAQQQEYGFEYSPNMPNTSRSRPQFRTHVSIDTDSFPGPNQEAKMFNSSSVPCLLDYPDNEPLHPYPRPSHVRDAHSGTSSSSDSTVRSAQAPRTTSKGRTYALSGVPPWKFTHSPPVPNQTAHKSLIRPIAFKPITTPPSSSPSSTAAPQPYGGPHNTTSPPPPPRPSPPQGYSNGGNRNGNSGFHPQQQRAQNSHGRPPHPQHQNSQNSHQSSSQESTPVSGAAPLSKSTYLTDSGQKIIGSSSDSGRADSYNSSSLGRASHNSSGSGGRASGNVGGGSVNGGNGMMDSSFIQTPSPSDSGLGELEAMIRDRDVQIRQLRDTMERNETAILKVCEEKEQNWEMKFREMHGDWEKKLRLQQQTAFKMEQALLMQLFKLQQERKTMKLETESLRSDKESREREVASLREEATSAKTKLEETQWDMCQKVGEISHLKVQLKESKDNLAQKSTDVLSLRAQLKESQRDCGEKNGEILGLESELKLSQEALKDMRKELDHMQAQIKAVENKTKNTGKVQDNNVTTTTTSSDSSPADLQIKKLKEELSKFKTDHEADKDRWLAEKDKVIRYQRHLQLNYVQMANKNKMLEAEVQQLTLELEGRDISLESSKMAGEPEESMC